MFDMVLRRGLGVAVAISLVAPHVVVLGVFTGWALLAVASRHRAPSPPTPRSSAFVLTALLLVLTVAASLFVMPFGFQAARLLTWFALAALLATACRRASTVVELGRALGQGAALGAVAAGVAAVVEVGAMGAVRADAFTGNAIVFGNLALILGAAGWWLAPRRAWALAGIIAAVIASVLSGSRGGWLAVPLVVLLALVDQHRQGRVVPWTRLALGGVALVAGATTLGGGMPVERLTDAVHDVTAYVEAEAPEPATGTSIGARFEAWRAAGAAFAQHPLLGVGWGALDREFDHQVADGLRHPRIATFTHAHHHLLGAAASGGVPGLMAAAAVLAVPGWWFWRAWRSASRTARHVAALGLSVVTGFVVFGQTEAIFDDGIAVALYAVIIGVALRLLDHVEQSGQIDTRSPAVPASPE